MDVLHSISGEAASHEETDDAGSRTGDVGYDELPESIKATYTHEQWKWFSDKEKANLVATECEPDAYEDS